MLTRFFSLSASLACVLLSASALAAEPNAAASGPDLAGIEDLSKVKRPPRTIQDVLRAVESSKVDPTELEKARAIVATPVPADASIDARVDIGPIPQGFGIAVHMKISLPGLERAVAQDLVDSAHQVCPYSNATRGNIVVELTLA